MLKDDVWVVTVDGSVLSCCVSADLKPLHGQFVRSIEGICNSGQYKRGDQEDPPFNTGNYNKDIMFPSSVT